MASGKQIRCGAIGYGGAFNMGKAHAEWMREAGMNFVAVCDIDPARCEAATEENPGIETWFDYHDMLDTAELDLVAVILPHDIHAEVAIECSKKRTHVVSEKPMCLSTEQADRMIYAAERTSMMLSVFHSRRWDGDYMSIKEIVEAGTIGDIVHIEAAIGSYGQPQDWWRSDKEISGGVMFDWGAHLVDWVLGLEKSDIKGVQGALWSGHWKGVTNEDQGQVVIRFESGASADIQVGQLVSITKPKWRILGTKGGITCDWDEDITLKVAEGDELVESTIEPKESTWGEYYKIVAKHIRGMCDPPVLARDARRVIAILEAAEESAKTGKTIQI
jgi:predicted dehydrogenase